MIRFVIGKDYGYKDGKLLVKAQLECDEIDELPAVNFFEGKLLDSGSQCWVIGTGDLYGLTSTGDWVKVNFMGNGEGGGGGSAYAHSLELTINSQTYVLTATLKNTSGETLGTPQTIDLPLETMVVSGSYDDTTKKVILTLKNGNTVDFSVADLVNGLQTEITLTNKLNSDLVNDTNQNNKFVTSAEKAQIAANTQNISGKQDTIDSSHKLNSDLVDDTNQNNKFVTSAEKTKIANALTEEVYNAGKQVAANNKTGEIFNNYSGNKATGNYSHAEGSSTTAEGYCSHAEGTGTTASKAYSHAEGCYTTALGQCSHAECYYTTASGDYSHAEGSAYAGGDYSHAEGNSTIARSNNQHVQGKYNIEDSSDKYAFIIGNGTDGANRSNAFAIDWDGKIYVGNSSTGVDVSDLLARIIALENA